MTKTIIMKGAEPYFLPGNSIGCLMIHGFTGTPKELRWMGEYLNNQGFTVLGIRLAGHATQVSDLIRIRWWDWLTSVEDGINFLGNACEQIFTIGLSMGGILSLIAAERYATKGLICMSTPYLVSNDWRLNFAQQLSVIQPFVKKGARKEKDKEAAAGHLDYPVYPTRSIAELNKLTREMHAILPKITKPALIIHSKSDDLNFQNSIQIHERIGSTDKELFLVEKSGHVITEDIERDIVFQKTAGFIKRVSQIKK